MVCQGPRNRLLTREPDRDTEAGHKNGRKSKLLFPSHLMPRGMSLFQFYELSLSPSPALKPPIRILQPQSPSPHVRLPVRPSVRLADSWISMQDEDGRKR